MKYKVITAVATEPVTSAQAKLHLRVDSSADDDLITGLITAARETAEHYTGCALAPQTLEAALDAFPDGECIRLPMGPVSSVTSIKYDDTAGDEQTLATADYSLSTYSDSRTVNLDPDATWPSTQDKADAVRVRYVTGYTSCPKAAYSAILLILAHLYENRGEAGDIPAGAKALLDTVKVYG